MKTEQLDIQDGNWSSDKGKDVMDAWNVKFGDEIEAVLCNNDTMAMGAIESLKTAGAFDDGNGPIVYGINGIPDVGNDRGRLHGRHRSDLSLSRG